WRSDPDWDGRVLSREDGWSPMKLAGAWWRSVVAGGALASAAGSLAAQEAGIAVGTRAPAVVVPALDAPPVDLAALIGRKPFLLEFWATWCEVCEALMPTVRQAHGEFGDRVEFLGVNVTVNQTPERVR